MVGILDLLNQQFPSSEGLFLDQDSDVISAPVIHNTIFVSGLTGSDDNDGLSLETPVASLKWAVSLAVSGTRIWVMAGEYRCVRVRQVDSEEIQNTAAPGMKGMGQGTWITAR